MQENKNIITIGNEAYDVSTEEGIIGLQAIFNVLGEVNKESDLHKFLNTPGNKQKLVDAELLGKDNTGESFEEIKYEVAVELDYKMLQLKQEQEQKGVKPGVKVETQNAPKSVVDEQINNPQEAENTVRSPAEEAPGKTNNYKNKLSNEEILMHKAIEEALENSTSKEDFAVKVANIVAGQNKNSQEEIKRTAESVYDAMKNTNQELKSKEGSHKKENIQEKVAIKNPITEKGFIDKLKELIEKIKSALGLDKKKKSFVRAEEERRSNVNSSKIQM